MRLAVISNRTFETAKDGWFQIAPIGEFKHPSGIIQVIDKDAIDEMVNRFETESKEPHFPGLLLDFDHFSNDTKAPSEAAGWITALANRDNGKASDPANGLWAQIKFSDVGESAVKNGRYRLASPVWNRKECEDLGGNRFRPQRLDRCALTNDPVLKGMVPLSNRSAPTVEHNAEEIDTLRAEILELKEELTNRGTSAGAHKGWETRRGALAAHHASRAKELNLYADRREKAGATREARQSRTVAANHAALAREYAAKAKASGAKAHINSQLAKLRKPKVAALKLDPKKIAKARAR
jgi:phage I-like protein